MSKTHCIVKYFNSTGDFVKETTTHDEGCIPGVARTLQQPKVKTVEIHLNDGTSKEYSFLD